MASRTIRPRPRHEMPRPSALARIINGAITLFVVGFLCMTGFLMWPMVTARVTGVPSQDAPATPGAPLSAPAASAPRLPAAQSYAPSGDAPALPARNPGGSYNSPAAANTAYAVAVATTTAITSTAIPAPCELITWADGSQSCDDGRAISVAQSQPGYCTPITWQDGSVSCNDGKPSGKVVWPDPEVQAEPTNTPWPAAPDTAVNWSAADGPNANTCVTVTWPDGKQQTACSDPNVKLDSDDAAFVARMIEDGKIAPGVGAPKG